MKEFCDLFFECTIRCANCCPLTLSRPPPPFGRPTAAAKPATVNAACYIYDGDKYRYVGCRDAHGATLDTGRIHGLGGGQHTETVHSLLNAGGEARRPKTSTISVAHQPGIRSLGNEAIQTIRSYNNQEAWVDGVRQVEWDGRNERDLELEPHTSR